MSLDDRTLLANWHAGDNEAGAALFTAHYDAMVRFFRNKVDDAVRDDLVQQTFIAASTARFDGRSKVRTWLFGIAWRKMVDYFRSVARRGRVEAFDMGTVSVADLAISPETRVVARQEQRLLLEGLRRLPLHQQVVLELHYWESMSASAIAEALDIPLGTAKTRLRDGRIRLTREIENIGESGDALRSTLDDLDAWALRAREAANPA